MSRLARNLTSEYVKRAAQLSRKEHRNIHKVYAYVEGYDDVAFWRSILQHHETETLRFEINVPTRDDLAKGKMVLMSMLENCGDNMILCMDSDFDYIFDGRTEKSSIINSNPYIFQTYVYSIENYLCYPPSLRSTCVKATKNDAFIFDFEKFMKNYSRTIKPLFMWYVYSAFNRRENFFTLNDFRNSVKLHYLTVENDGDETISWLNRQVQKKVKALEVKHPHLQSKIKQTELELAKREVTADNIYLYMHGHTLFNNVVAVAVETVCETLKVMKIELIRSSTRTGVSLANELSNYKNCIRPATQVLMDNEEYKESPLFKRVEADIERFVTSIKLPEKETQAENSNP